MSAAVLSPPPAKPAARRRVRPIARPPAAPRLTEAEYLKIERTTPDGPRHEFVDGGMIEMSGASFRHSQISKRTVNALDALIAAREGGGPPLGTFGSGTRIRVPSGRYRYPDVYVVPIPPQMLDGEGDVILNPLVIVEVLSPTTADTDRTTKLAEYRAIPSLTDYLLLDQDAPAAEHHAREPGGEWRTGEASVAEDGPDAALALHGLGELMLAPLYPPG